MSRTAQRGVTIIEVMIAVAIVGILMALAAPSANVWIQNTQLRNGADSVYNGVQLARIEALKRNVLVSFELLDPQSTAWHICLYDPLTNACSATQADLHSKGAKEAGENARVGADTALSDTSAVLAIGANVPGAVTFDPLGRIAPTAPVNIMRVDVRNPTLSSSDERRLVILISVGGQIRLCDPKLPFASNPKGCA
jgi:type IV fimbrial biogenesis protein FimT